MGLLEGDVDEWENAERKGKGGEEETEGWEANNGEIRIEEQK